MAKARNLLSLLTAASLAAFSATKPLKTTTSKLMTVEGPHGSDGALLINVLRTDDLIADKIPSKPLLLEKISHLLIRVELSPTKCSINGHSLPLVPSHSKEMVKAGKVQEEVDPKTGSVKLKMMVEMKQVQTLKLPKDSPLVPLGLTSPELLKISDKYIAEGVVGAMLSVSEEPLEVEAATIEGDKLEAQAHKVTIGIQILEIDGVFLSTTDLPSIDLLQLIVHPDPLDSSKVVSITTLTPDALKGSQVVSSSSPADHYATSLMRGIEASLLSAFDMFASMMKKVSHNSELEQALPKTQQRKGCRMGRPHHSGHHRLESEALSNAPVQSKSADNEALAQKSPEMTYEPKHHFTSPCFLTMLWRSLRRGPTVFLLGIPALILLGVIVAANKLAARIRFRREQKLASDVAAKDENKALLGAYEDMAEEKAAVVVVVTSPPSA